MRERRPFASSDSQPQIHQSDIGAWESEKSQRPASQAMSGSAVEKKSRMALRTTATSSFFSGHGGSWP